MTIKNIAGALETIDAAGQTGNTSGLSDVANQLRGDIIGFYQELVDGVGTVLGQFGDDGDKRVQTLREMRDQWQRDLNEVAPHTADRVNPQTQPGDPNPSAWAERDQAEQPAEEERPGRREKAGAGSRGKR